MTIAELIEQLQQYPPDVRVVVSGYEAGVDDVTAVREVRVVVDYYDENYFGCHSARSGEGTPAIYIHGRHEPGEDR